PINDADYRKENHDTTHSERAKTGKPRAFIPRRSGKHRQVEAKEAIGSKLQQDRGKNDRTGGGRLYVSVREPGVKGKHRYLDRKTESKSKKQQDLSSAHRQHRSDCLHVDDVERASCTGGISRCCI